MVICIQKKKKFKRAKNALFILREYIERNGEMEVALDDVFDHD